MHALNNFSLSTCFQQAPWRVPEDMQDLRDVALSLQGFIAQVHTGKAATRYCAASAVVGTEGGR